MAVLKAATLPHGLVPIFVRYVYLQARCGSLMARPSHSPQTGHYGVSPIRLGSRGDSYYEYLMFVFPIWDWTYTDPLSTENSICRL